eukprot:147125-Alexandrium_andersonii.AAC.1
MTERDAARKTIRATIVPPLASRRPKSNQKQRKRVETAQPSGKVDRSLEGAAARLGNGLPQ